MGRAWPMRLSSVASTKRTGAETLKAAETAAKNSKSRFIMGVLKFGVIPLFLEPYGGRMRSVLRAARRYFSCCQISAEAPRMAAFLP